ncbi:hypothetical protein BKA69DRAFT_1039598 [Paraphysoderma sedebokerense]|nr:hypothetical protein BKA69DRAFT_1039598 [Paraphysoderma sedebokerense]
MTTENLEYQGNSNMTTGYTISDTELLNDWFVLDLSTVENKEYSPAITMPATPNTDLASHMDVSGIMDSLLKFNNLDMAAVPFLPFLDTTGFIPAAAAEIVPPSTPLVKLEDSFASLGVFIPPTISSSEPVPCPPRSPSPSPSSSSTSSEFSLTASAQSGSYAKKLIPLDAPIQKKNLKRAVSEDEEDPNVVNKRLKNTLSARRSRARRAMKLQCLETENDQLRAELNDVKKELAELKAMFGMV